MILRSPRGRVNFHGADIERWYFTEGIGALANVQDGENIRLAGPAWFDLQHWRESVLDKLTEKAPGNPAFRILTALAIADRRGLLARDREIFSATGTGHLLAISGLHIGLAATLGFYLGRLGLLFLFDGSETTPCDRPAMDCRLAGSPWVFSLIRLRGFHPAGTDHADGCHGGYVEQTKCSSVTGLADRNVAGAGGRSFCTIARRFLVFVYRGGCLDDAVCSAPRAPATGLA